jgi:hypothetical protein
VLQRVPEAIDHAVRAVHRDPAERAWAREKLGWWVPRVRHALARTGVPTPPA